MPWLSARKLYTKPEMMRAFLRAGQFAHLTDKDISSRLDELHSPQFRYSKTTNKYQMAVIENCVPELLLSLSRKNALQPLYRPHTYQFLVEMHGCLCAMCFDVTNARQVQTAENVRDAIFWTPDMYGYADYEFGKHGIGKNKMEFFYEYPANWCHACESAVYNSKPYKEFRKMMWNCSYSLPRKMKEIEEMWATLKAIPYCIQNKPQFLERISRNKTRYIRFDPRRKHEA
tara:strand:+ start:720 stop:1409 length:690 start_codon:yes stop_codon:yes gene_type:complete